MGLRRGRRTKVPPPYGNECGGLDTRTVILGSPTPENQLNPVPLHMFSLQSLTVFTYIFPPPFFTFLMTYALLLLIQK